MYPSPFIRIMVNPVSSAQQCRHRPLLLSLVTLNWTQWQPIHEANQSNGKSRESIDTSENQSDRLKISTRWLALPFLIGQKGIIRGMNSTKRILESKEKRRRKRKMTHELFIFVMQIMSLLDCPNLIDPCALSHQTPLLNRVRCSSVTDTHRCFNYSHYLHSFHPKGKFIVRYRKNNYGFQQPILRHSVVALQ